MDVAACAHTGLANEDTTASGSLHASFATSLNLPPAVPGFLSTLPLHHLEACWGVLVLGQRCQDSESDVHVTSWCVHSTFVCMDIPPFPLAQVTAAAPQRHTQRVGTGNGPSHPAIHTILCLPPHLQHFAVQEHHQLQHITYLVLLHHTRHIPLFSPAAPCSGATPPASSHTWCAHLA